MEIGTPARSGDLQEREAELARIERWLTAVSGGRGGVLVIEGAAGIGKTALLGSARSVAAAAGIRVLHAQGAQLEREFPFGVVRQLFEPVLTELPDEERTGVLQGAAGIAARLLALPGAVSHEVSQEVSAAPDSSFAVLHGLYWLSANLAASRPHVLVVDDAHWADTPSLRFLAFLQPRLAELPVALLLAARPGEAGSAELALLATLGGDATALHVAPAPLSETGVGRLIAAGLGEEPEAGFTSACHRANRGNPFLVGQLVAALAENRVAPNAEATARIEILGARWAARWILLRLARLPTPSKQLADALAILEHGELAHAARLAGLDEHDAVAAADALITVGILARGRPLEFVHPIVRAAVYSEIGTAARAAGHRRAARVLAAAAAAPARVVEHLLASSRPASLGVPAVVAAARERPRRGPGIRGGRTCVGRSASRPPRTKPPDPAPRARHRRGQRRTGLPHDHMRDALAESRWTSDAASLPLRSCSATPSARDNRFEEALDVLDRVSRSPGQATRRRS